MFQLKFADNYMIHRVNYCLNIHSSCMSYKYMKSSLRSIFIIIVTECDISALCFWYFELLIWRELKICIFILAATTWNLIIAGTMKGFGVLFVEFVEYYDCSPTEASMMPCVQGLMMLIVGEFYLFWRSV